ncbi:MAG: WbqC family protein [candidate division FCPU426 bacterium]
MILTLHQPQYLPYLGYFDKVAAADRFVLLDKPQFEKNDYQNRNRVKTAAGPLWLSVPVLTKGKSGQALHEVEINPREDWQRKHWATLELNYKKAPFWAHYAPLLAPFYNQPWARLVELNLAMYRFLSAELGVSTPFEMESELGSEGESTERLISLCKKTGADTYLSGAGGKAYMDEARFGEEGLSLRYQHYQHPVYRQQHMKQGFVPNLCVLDLLFNEGPESRNLFRSTLLQE